MDVTPCLQPRPSLRAPRLPGARELPLPDDPEVRDGVARPSPRARERTGVVDDLFVGELQPLLDLVPPPQLAVVRFSTAGPAPALERGGRRGHESGGECDGAHSHPVSSSRVGSRHVLLSTPAAGYRLTAFVTAEPRRAPPERAAEHDEHVGAAQKLGTRPE